MVDAPADRQWEGVKRVFAADEATQGRRGRYFFLVWSTERGGEGSLEGVALAAEAKR